MMKSTLISNKIIIDHLKKYNPQMIGIFGSYARNDHNENSDLDILVDFKDRLSFLQLVGIEQELSEKLKVTVDLVTLNALKNEKLKNYIYQDLKVIYE